MIAVAHVTDPDFGTLPDTTLSGSFLIDAPESRSPISPKSDGVPLRQSKFREHLPVRLAHHIHVQVLEKLPTARETHVLFRNRVT